MDDLAGFAAGTVAAAKFGAIATESRLRSTQRGNEIIRGESWIRSSKGLFAY